MATWRTMTSNDIPTVLRIADEIHPTIPESASVFAERAELFPEGCLVLVQDNEIGGYAISHPIRARQPPPPDTLLGGIAPDADQYYIHDVAILPHFRGRGSAAAGIGKLLVVAERYSSACLISVYGTAGFWGRFGFVGVPIDGDLEEKVRGYGDDAAYLLRQRVSR